MPSVDLRLGDCLEVMAQLPDGSIDAAITDLPYGTTRCKWDAVIPLEPMWIQIKRLLKQTGAFITTASQPFTSALVMSNPKMFKCEWIWKKNQPSGLTIAKYQPMKNHESILVFSSGITTYNKQPTTSLIKDRKLGVSNGKFRSKRHEMFGINPVKTSNPDNILLESVNPRTVIEFDIAPNAKGKFHHAQKPVPLYEYLVRTYTNEGETVLDFCMGSGTTGVACVGLNRNFIGIEIAQDYFEIAKKRIADIEIQYYMTLK